MSTVQDTELHMGKRWLMFAAVYLIGIMAGVCMFKAPPLFSTEFASELGFTDASIGWVMSIFAMTCVILAFPASAILSQLGPKKSLTITAISLGVGALCGALAPNATVMLVSRFIEGIGMGLVTVVGPAAVATIIPIQRRGLAMSIWAIFLNVGIVVAFNAAPVVYEVFGTWRAVWWAAAILCACALVFMLAIYQETTPLAADAETAGASSGSLKPDMVAIILTSLAFCAWNMVNVGSIGSFYPAYLTDIHAFDTQTAGVISSITNAVVLVLGPLSGWVSDRFGIRKGLLAFSLFGVAGATMFGFSDNLTMVWVFIFVMSFFSAAAGTGAYALIPFLAKDPDKIGMGMAILAFCQNIGILVGSAAMGSIAAAVGWNTAAWVFCVPVSLVGAVLVLFVTGKKRNCV